MRAIKKNEKIIALVFDTELEEGTHPLTDEKFALQIVALKHPAGKILPAHYHKPADRHTKQLVEGLFVISGKVRVSVYHQKEQVESVDLSAGQGVMIVDGGMGIEVLEDAQMYEFKNGPFIEDKELI